MLRFIQYHSSVDFFQSPESYLSGEVKVICPNPNKADEARSRFDEAGFSADCVTISKFVKDEVRQLIPEEQLGNFKGKSELLLFLGAIWKKLNPDPSYKYFVHAFNIFTELRSFTVDETLQENLLEFYEPDIAKMIKIFQKIMTDMEVMDEHGAYNNLTQRLRDGDLPADYNSEQQLVFYGFETMTSSQVDLLKAWGLRCDISILMYKQVMDNASDLDWVKWLQSENDIIIAPGLQSRSKVFKRTFPKNYIFQTLQQLPEVDGVILGTKSLNYDYIQELPWSTISFKDPVDLFGVEFHRFWKTIEASTYHTSDLRAVISKEMSAAVEAKNFIRLKAILVFLNKVNQWEELSDANSELADFDFELIKESAYLDLPRVNKVNLEKAKLVRTLGGIDNIRDKKLYLVLSSSHTKLNFMESNYTDKIEEKLASIGPLRRAEFEYHLYLAKLKELVSLNEITFLEEEQFTESDLYWKRIMGEFDIDSATTSLKFGVNKKYNDIPKVDHQIKRLSSSRLQTYSDCPRKYYFSYVEKMGPKPTLKAHFDALEMGLVQHQMIEEYLKMHSEFSETKFLALANKILAKFIRNKSTVNVEPILVELKAYTYSVIQFLIQLKNEDKFEFAFEKEFETEEEVKKNGSIDCFGESNQYSLLLDFKRSGFSFSSYQSILDFEKNQLWFYLSRLLDLKLLDLNKKLAFGYIDLSNLENSMIFSEDKELLELIKNRGGIKRTRHLDDLEDLMNEYRSFENEEISRLSQDKEFLPRPMNSKVCDFCFLGQTCSRGSE